MEMKHWLSAAVGCMGLVLCALPAAAAPISGVTSNPQLAADASSVVEKTHWRRYAYYYSEIADDSFERYYPYEDYRYSYIYPSYDYYYAYPRYRHYHHHHHHRHYRHYPHYRRW